MNKFRKNEMIHPQDAVQQEPDFLRNRVDAYYHERVQETWNGGHILKGQIPKVDDVVLSSNDYLSISNHPSITQAKVDSLLKSGNGLMMSSVFAHGDTADRKFEKAIAKFVQAEDAVLSQSGWCANTGLIQSIANETTPVYIDMFAHMSLWEGIQSANAKAVPFIHNDAEHLEKLIQKFGTGIVIVDSVYSTSGDVSPLTAIVEVADRYGCVMIVDESHSLGTHGEHGEGLVVGLGLCDKVHFRTASLAKAFAGRGGIIMGSTRNMEYFRYEARPAIFSSAVLPHDTAGFIAALDIIKQDDWRRTKLIENSNYVRNGLRNLGYNVEDSKSQIISLESGREQQTIILRDALEAKGIFGSVFCSPATPKNRSLIRFSISTDVTKVVMDKLLNVCEEIRSEVDMNNWPSTRRLQRYDTQQNAKIRVLNQNKARSNIVEISNDLDKAEVA